MVGPLSEGGISGAAFFIKVQKGGSMFTYLLIAAIIFMIVIVVLLGRWVTK
jgi:hypothetical protein